MMFVLRRVTAPFVLLAVALAAGCSKTIPIIPIVNIPPEVRLTAAPIDTNAICAPDPARSCYSLTLNWVGNDPDGRVDHFIYSVDPPDDGDTTWVVTTANEKRLVFEAPSQSPRRDSLTILRGFHVFVIAAVDNNNAIGPRANRAFFSFTKAPTVTIDSPRPITGAQRLMPPSIRISWHGVDDDGVFTTKPVRFKYLLLGPGNESNVIPGGIDAIFASKGVAIRKYFAPEFRADQGWITIGGDTTTIQFTNLLPGARYLFTIVAFDEAGAFSPVFGFDTNILRFSVGFAAAFGPKITMFNESFHYEWSSYNPANEVRIEVSSNQKVRFSWFATPPPGADITAYRWMLDGDVFDQRPRNDENVDLNRWSTPSVNTTTAEVGPFTGGEHFFYVEAEDNTGLKALATVHMSVISPTFARPLLIVDDTRYRPDNFLGNGDQIGPQGLWPGAAELDTFLYAVGGVPWDKPGRTRYPPGTLSPAGILNGYEYDTLGTRNGLAEVRTPLAVLGQYRHVIWLIDFASATFGNSGNHPDGPTTSLRYMSNTGRLNTLGAYLRMGGDAWLVGGGGAYATLIWYDDGTNNIGAYVWNSTNPKRELVPGRFMYDAAKWQSVIKARSSVSLSDQDGTAIIRSLGRFSTNPGIYAGLPISLDTRNPNSDPLPPLRTDPLYYRTTFACEFLSSDNTVQESVQGEAVDFKIDAFDDTTAAPVIARWPSSDATNTVVDQAAVTAAGTTRASGKALRIRTQGGGASTGDVVTHTFNGDPRDWSGLSSLRLNIKPDQPSSLVQWRIRAIDTRGASASAPIPATGTGQFTNVEVPQNSFTTDPTSPYEPNFVRIRKVQLELALGNAAGTTDFDNLEVITLTDGAVLDTLLALKSFSESAPIQATMTVYHGHDFPKPFIFTGFAPWDFRRSQCQALFDFVLQRMWGMTKQPGTFASGAATFAPAHATRPAAPRVGLRRSRD